ncbi:hypothetical protein A2971_01450 [Candidatus Gottesmanbacteria bacterium RIFCSPLOWO2_01_FULL_46_21]|uniref:DegT/DnrJ/EryC1/StrS aminotransferase family protein n=2 Tax=Microgenomates group TaxID=1794810 RepID=A0A0G0WHY4_9BACT|nr:MAG: DegT/DnrJ/EryC1/StrS aminotransferase family protein [Candidatus Daviesbacteria bacterium GW2011_GWB1_41_5]OGG29795.1 MAG: hypothetical protein A2971_01450 [Candidatus Gottesmanbacteria bacterium RIFCSPLOWO2_01_FULL_46_21]
MKKFTPQIEPLIGLSEIRAVNAYMQSGGWLTEFKETAVFEARLTDFLGCRFATIVSNGTVSLFLSLGALGIGPGDEIIVPDLTMIASANAILLAGATPVLVDIDPDTLCLDLGLIDAKLTRRTKAVILVAFNGRSPNMEKVIEFCRSRNLYLIEDAAQAFGSKWRRKYLGTFGDYGSFSFSYPKIITTGQGGAVITNKREYIERVEKLKDFGRRTSGVDEHITIGYNFKFSDLLAVVGNAQIANIGWRVKRKKEIYALYQKELSDTPQIRFIPTDLSQTCPWFVDIYISDRDMLALYLKSKNIGTRPIYPPVHTQSPYNAWDQFKTASFAVSEKVSKTGLFLPSSLTLSDMTIRKICAQIASFYKKSR